MHRMFLDESLDQALHLDLSRVLEVVNASSRDHGLRCRKVGGFGSFPERLSQEGQGVPVRRVLDGISISWSSMRFRLE